MVKLFLVLHLVGMLGVYGEEEGEFTTLLTLPTPAAVDTSTSPLVSTSRFGPGCLCQACPYNIHPQTHYCQGDAVIRGKVVKHELVTSAMGSWTQEEYTQLFENVYPPEVHYRPEHGILNIKVHEVYKGDKELEGINLRIRYFYDLGCKESYPLCSLTVVDHRTKFSMMKVEEGYRYVFFLPKISSELFDGMRESILHRCSPVWRYTLKEDLNPIPGFRVRMLQQTNCEECRISSCKQDKCVAASDVETCDRFEPPISVQERNCHVFEGACYKDPLTGICNWRRTNAIEECISS